MRVSESLSRTHSSRLRLIIRLEVWATLIIIMKIRKKGNNPNLGAVCLGVQFESVFKLFHWQVNETKGNGVESPRATFLYGFHPGWTEMAKPGMNKL